MTYAVALPNSEGAQPGALTPGDFVPDESAFLVKRDNVATAQDWVKANRQRITFLVGDAPIVYTTNRGKILKQPAD